MSKHTPGPWAIVERQDPVMVSGWHVQIGSVELPFFPYTRVYSEDRSQSSLARDAKQMANARLIAAAPDLLEALKLIVQWDGADLILLEHHIERARAAIKKAEENT